MQGSNGWVVVVAKPEDDWGWAVGHVYIDDPFPINNPSGTLSAFEEVGPTALIDWPHVHLMWLEAWPTPSSYNSTGYFNPFYWMSQDPDLRNDLIGYDEVMFNYCYSPFPGNGLWFMPDECEIPAQFPFPEYALFQSRVFGKVDVGVSPYSAFNGEPERDSVGVNTVGYKILMQNPYTEGYEDLDEGSISIFGGNYRLLVSMDDGEMTLEDSPEYRALFVDGNTRTQSQEQNMRHHNAYILTNSGTQSMGSGVDVFNSGWDNVWTDSYDRDADWNDEEFLRGAWDTRLGNSNSNKTALINNQAVFPDGRYAFKVKALSQGTAFLDFVNQEWSERVLPCEGPHIENSPTTGVVVDNFLPYVDSVIVYCKTGDGPRDIRLLYAAGWTEDTQNGTADSTQNVYNYLPFAVSISTQLWVAVKYSEPMVTGLGDVWITAEMRGQQEWDSTTDGIFSPGDTQSEWPPKFGPLNADGGMWQLYRYDGILPSEYNGRLTLHIDHNSEHPVDLSGNSIDGDPSTIAEPRNADGSWSGIGYELENDDSYTWGECDWYVHGSGTQNGYFYATVGESIVQIVTFSELGYHYGSQFVHTVNADIEYNCGAFVSQYYIESGIYIHDHRIRVIDGDGDWVGHTYLIGPTQFAGTSPYWSMTHDTTPGTENGSEWENKFYWIRHRFVFYHNSQDRYESEEHWFGCNGHTGMQLGLVKNTAYFGDYCLAWSNTDRNTDSRGWYFINCNNPEPEYILDVGWHIPVYYIEEGNPNPYYRGEMFAPTQVPSDDILCLDDKDELNTEAISKDYIFSLPPLMPNPATSSVVVLYSIESAGYYEIMVYDLCGRVHAELVHGEVTPGMHSVTWNLSDDRGVNLPAGTYLVRLTGCNQEEIQKLIILE